MENENLNKGIEKMYVRENGSFVAVKPQTQALKENVPQKQEIASTDLKQVEKPTLPTFKYDEKKSVDENASDISELVANKIALEDGAFVSEVAETKKEAIKESAKVNKEIHLTKKEAEKIVALNERDEAFFEQWKPILTWGGLKEPCKKSLATFLLWLILPFYTIVTIGITLPLSMISTLFGAINGLLEEIKTFGKIARSIAFTILILGTIGIVALIILSILDKYNVVQIFHEVPLT